MTGDLMQAPIRAVVIVMAVMVALWVAVGSVRWAKRHSTSSQLLAGAMILVLGVGVPIVSLHSKASKKPERTRVRMARNPAIHPLPDPVLAGSSAAPPHARRPPLVGTACPSKSPTALSRVRLVEMAGSGARGVWLHKSAVIRTYRRSSTDSMYRGARCSYTSGRPVPGLSPSPVFRRSRGRNPECRTGCTAMS